jgi:hypothetical protein
VEDLAYADDDNIDDHDLKATYYPEELWQWNLSAYVLPWMKNVPLMI